MLYIINVDINQEKYSAAKTGRQISCGCLTKAI